MPPWGLATDSENGVAGDGGGMYGNMKDRAHLTAGLVQLLDGPHLLQLAIGRAQAAVGKWPATTKIVSEVCVFYRKNYSAQRQLRIIAETMGLTLRAWPTPHAIRWAGARKLELEVMLSNAVCVITHLRELNGEGSLMQKNQTQSKSKMELPADIGKLDFWYRVAVVHSVMKHTAELSKNLQRDGLHVLQEQAFVTAWLTRSEQTSKLPLELDDGLPQKYLRNAPECTNLVQCPRGN